ncbi:MAG: hypothetical protein LBF12_01080 [Christensenellaceae bacterium]|nr:hypothetical protein [Christensenellaceae bacterium]
MFGKLYFQELKKALKLKHLFVLLLFLIAALSVFNLWIAPKVETYYFDELSSAQYIADDPDYKELTYYLLANYNYVVVKESQIDTLLENARIEYENARLGSDNFIKDVFEKKYGLKYSTKSLVVMFEYIKENKLYDQPIIVYGGTYSNVLNFDVLSKQGLAWIGNTIAIIICMIYVTIIASRIYQKDLEKGDIDLMQRLKKYGRNKFTIAKLFVTLTITFITFLLSFIISWFFATQFASDGNYSFETLIVFNASEAFMVNNEAAVLGLNFLTSFMLLTMCAVSVFAFAIILRNSLAASALWILSITTIPFFLSNIGMSNLWISNSALVNQYFGINGPYGFASNIFISIIMYIFFIALFIVASVVIMRRRVIDITIKRPPRRYEDNRYNH